MMNTLTDRLPDWSKTIDPKYVANYIDLKTVALEFLELSEPVRRDLVRHYSSQFCFPRLNEGKASGLYVFLRVIFDLPIDQPREKTQTFGGWLHPSIGERGPFNISWPVSVDQKSNTMTIERYQGYSGKGYDGIGEFDYFRSHFAFRRKEKLAAITLQ